MIKAFLSYQHDDKEQKDKIINLLKKENNFDVWADDELIGGAQYRRKIARRIYESNIFIVLISKNSMNSSWVNQELDYALNKGKYILPIWLEKIELDPEFEFVVQNRHYIYWNERKNDDIFLEQIRKAIDEYMEEIGHDDLIEKDEIVEAYNEYVIEETFEEKEYKKLLESILNFGEYILKEHNNEIISIKIANRLLKYMEDNTEYFKDEEWIGFQEKVHLLKSESFAQIILKNREKEQEEKLAKEKIPKISLKEMLESLEIPQKSQEEMLDSLEEETKKTYPINELTYSKARDLANKNRDGWLEIPEGYTHIGQDALRDMYGVEKIAIPSTITEGLTEETFKHCYSLKKIKVDKRNPVYKDVNGALYQKGINRLIRSCAKR